MVIRKEYFEEGTVIKTIAIGKDVEITLSHEVYSYMIANGFRQEDDDLKFTKFVFHNCTLFLLKGAIPFVIKEINSKENNIELIGGNSSLKIIFDTCKILKINSME